MLFAALGLIHGVAQNTAPHAVPLSYDQKTTVCYSCYCLSFTWSFISLLPTVWYFFGEILTHASFPGFPSLWLLGWRSCRVLWRDASLLGRATERTPSSAQRAVQRQEGWGDGVDCDSRWWWKQGHDNGWTWGKIPWGSSKEQHPRGFRWSFGWWIWEWRRWGYGGTQACWTWEDFYGRTQACWKWEYFSYHCF